MSEDQDQVIKNRMPPWAWVLLVAMGGGSGGMMATGEKICRSLYGEEITEASESNVQRPIRRVRENIDAKIRQNVTK